MRGYSNYKNTQTIAVSEKIIAALTYLSVGIVGFLWIVMAAVAGKKLKPFIRFHAYQSIFLSVLYAVFSKAVEFLYGILYFIPFVGVKIFHPLYFYLFDYKLILGVSIVDFSVLAIILYLVIISLMGKFGNIPKVSDLIKQLM